MVKRAAASLNGITIAYTMGIVNALLATMDAFGLRLTDQQSASVTALINASLIATVHVSHRVGETHAEQVNGIAQPGQVAPQHPPAA